MSTTLAENERLLEAAFEHTIVEAKRMFRVLLFCLVASGPLASVTHAQENFGRFHGDLIVKALPDGRKLQLTHPFSYIDPNGKLWAVPNGAIVDGASIPQAFWSIIGGPFEDKYREASVVHDYYCDVKTEDWQQVHMAFYNAMRTSGVSASKAKTMFAAVYGFGPRWVKLLSSQSGALVSGLPILQEEAKLAILNFVSNGDPTITEIEAVTTKMTAATSVEQLEKVLYENVGCTPILSSSDAANDITKTIILCGLSQPSKRKVAANNLTQLSNHLKEVLIVNHWGLSISQEYISSPSDETWARLRAWAANARGLLKIALRSLLDVEKDASSVEGLFENLTARAHLLSSVDISAPMSKEQVITWSQEYRRLVVELRSRLQELEKQIRVEP